MWVLLKDNIFIQCPYKVNKNDFKIINIDL